MLELGIVLVRLGDEKSGIEQLERVRTAVPSWTAPSNALARVHFARGRHRQAIREAEVSLSLDPDQPEMRKLVEEASGQATSGSTP